MFCRTSFVLCLCMAFGFAQPVNAQTTFTDNFNSVTDGQADSLWNNEYGNWVVSSGTYAAQQISSGYQNYPAAVSTIKGLVVSDFTLDFDMLGASDGGVYIHSRGFTDALCLIVEPDIGAMYWIVRQNNAYSTSVLGNVGLNASPRADLHVHVVAAGSTYTAQATMGGNVIATTSINDSHFLSGSIGLYDNGIGQSFDNVKVLIPGAVLSGTVTLLDCSDPEQAITFEFRPKPNGTSFKRKQMLTQSGPNTGAFSLTSIPAGTYDIAIKGYSWLQQVIPNVVVSGNVSGLTATLWNGNLNGDDIVDIADFGILVNSYGSAGMP